MSLQRRVKAQQEIKMAQSKDYYTTITGKLH